MNFQLLFTDDAVVVERLHDRLIRAFRNLRIHLPFFLNNTNSAGGILFGVAQAPIERAHDFFYFLRVVLNALIRRAITIARKFHTSPTNETSLKPSRLRIATAGTGTMIALTEPARSAAMRVPSAPICISRASFSGSTPKCFSAKRADRSDVPPNWLTPILLPRSSGTERISFCATR